MTLIHEMQQEYPWTLNYIRAVNRFKESTVPWIFQTLMSLFEQYIKENSEESLPRIFNVIEGMANWLNFDTAMVSRINSKNTYKLKTVNKMPEYDLFSGKFNFLDISFLEQASEIEKFCKEKK